MSKKCCRNAKASECGVKSNSKSNCSPCGKLGACGCADCAEAFRTQVASELRVGFAPEDIFSPFISQNPVTGELSGYSIELLKEYASRLPCVNKIRFVRFDQISDEFIAIEQGLIDTVPIGDIDITGERLRRLGFVIAPNRANQPTTTMALLFLDSTADGSLNKLLGNPANGAKYTVCELVDAVGESAPEILTNGEGTVADLTLKENICVYPNVGTPADFSLSGCDDVFCFIVSNRRLRRYFIWFRN